MTRYLSSLAAAIILTATCACAAFAAEEAWRGVDETVVQKYASEHGRGATGSLINIEGDALLFAFLVAGTVGGFVMGYYYRDVVSGKKEVSHCGKGARDAG